MAHRLSPARAAVLVVAALLQVPGVGAQQGPVAAMFGDDEKREQALRLSFLSVELAAAATGSPLRVYLSAGDLERAFDRPQFRPDAAIVPTNTDLILGASSPATQRVLIDRVRRRADVMRDLEEQAAARRKELAAAASGDAGKLQIGVDTFMAQLPRGANPQPRDSAFPKVVCMIATDFPIGGAIDRRELFTQDRIRKGIATCLAALDESGAQSLVMPLMGAASSGTQTKDPVYEGQRLLKECRLINAVAGIALGVHDYSARRRNIRELGIVQWDREITDMFNATGGSRLAQAAYSAYAEQIKLALRKGLAGEKIAPVDIDGNCSATFNAQ